MLRFSSYLATLFDDANSQSESSTLVLNLTCNFDIINDYTVYLFDNIFIILASLFKKTFENNDSKETFCDEFLTEFGLLKVS